ncbi:hypothetical protein QQP08_012916, partial [Theobroma cacao]
MRMAQNMWIQNACRVSFIVLGSCVNLFLVFAKMLGVVFVAFFFFFFCLLSLMMFSLFLLFVFVIGFVLFGYQFGK